MSLLDALTAAGISRVAIIDDDSGEIGLDALPEDLLAILRDPDDPRFASLLDFAFTHGAIPDPRTMSGAELLVAASSPGMIRALCRHELEQALPTLHAEYVRDMLDEHTARQAPVTALLTILEEVGIGRQAIDVFGADVSVANLVEIPLIFVDLMLEPQSGSVQRASDLIQGLVRHCREIGRTEPLLVVMSINETMLRHHRRRLRSMAQVSASGFRIIPKAAVIGTTGRLRIELILTQLLRERAAVPEFRRFVMAWSDSVTAARDSFIEQLWALDLRSMQLLDEVARTEGIAFEDHVGDVLMRSLNWHVERRSEIQGSMTAVATTLNELIGGQASPSLLQDMFESTELDAINRHAIWHAPEWLRDIEPIGGAGDSIRWLKRNLGFGDVIVPPTFPTDPSVFLHLTQACDFARIDQSSNQRLLFIVGTAEPTTVDSGISETVATVLIRGFRCMDLDFSIRADLRNVRLISASVAARLFGMRTYRVTARMRPDAAQQILNRYAQHISRVAMPAEANVWPVAARVLRKAGAQWSQVRSSTGEVLMFPGSVIDRPSHRRVLISEPFASTLAEHAARLIEDAEGGPPPLPALTWFEHIVTQLRGGIRISEKGNGRIDGTAAIELQRETEQSRHDAEAWAQNKGQRVIVLYEAAEGDDDQA